MRVRPNALSLCLKIVLLFSLAGVFNTLTAKVPPHPKYAKMPSIKPSRASEQFGRITESKNRLLPQNILVLRAQFSDVTFQAMPAYPDSLPHDRAFFQRWVNYHLADFYAAASHNRYLPNFDVVDMVFNLSGTMASYGADTSEEYDARVPEMLQELIAMADPFINYNDYDAVIVFHAGAGQESDIDEIRTGEIWSTFVTRKDLQEAFDPENDDYPGLETADGKIIKEIVLVPESEFQDYFPLPPDETAYAYIFSLYGVLCHQFGHQIGLPTLFDNYSANGASQGIGNWGLMGTGLWNGNGNVPAQLSAWSRYYLGWEDAITVSDDDEDLQVDHFLDNNPAARRLYKIPISAREYFLVENRQQNPDGSTDPYTAQPSFTFALLDPSQQDYYDEPYEQRPFFNFMENRYKGCEWDFFLPGLGGPLQPWEASPTDGSGLLIWHIDENIIDEFFDPGFDYNFVNYDASHKGVDLEEADGIQHLDTALFDYYKYGGPYDSFRSDTNPAASNTYFGHGTISVPNTATPDTTDYVIVTHLPTAASYYGGVPLEIYDISLSGNQMTFSVSFGWKLSTGYSGINNLDACSVDTDNDGINEIFYPMPDGNLFLWKNEEIAAGFPINAPGDIKSYVWDGEAFYLALDMTNDPNLPMLSLRKLQDGQLTSAFTKPNGAKWAAQIMSFDDYLVLPVRSETNQDYYGSSISVFEKGSWQNPVDEWSFTADSLATNLAYFRNKIYAVTKSVEDGSYNLHVMTPGSDNVETYLLPIPADSILVAFAIAPLSPGSAGETIIQTPYSVYVAGLDGAVVNGYPIVLPFYTDTQVTINDTDGNGTLDYLVSGENSFAVYDYAGKNMLTNFAGLFPADSLYITSGVLSGDLDGDGRTEYIGAFSRNRLAAFEETQRLMSGFPDSYSDRSRNLPFIHLASDSLVYAWTATDNGKIFRSRLPQTALNSLDENWYCRYATLQRTSSRETDNVPNQYESASLFVPGETYIFPNPLKPIYEQRITFQIMTSRNAKVEASIFDIKGNLIYRKQVDCLAYLKNKELVELPVKNISSGVYLAVLKSGDTIKRMKFAVEK